MSPHTFYKGDIKVSLKGKIIDSAFPGMKNIWKNCVEYETGDPDNVLELDDVSPYSAGTMAYDASTDIVYFKTDEDSTSWVKISGF